MANAKLEAVITPDGIKVALHDWEGVTTMMIENIHYAIYKQAQVYRAEKLNAMHKADKQAEAAAKLVEEKKVEVK